MNKDMLYCGIEKEYIIYLFLPYLCQKAEVGQEVYETISGLPQRGQGELLTINGDRVCEGYGIF